MKFIARKDIIFDMPYETEMSQSEYNEIQKQTFGIKEIKYSRPKFAHRVLANMIDFIIFAILFVASFLIVRNIVSNTTGYRNTFNSFIQMRLDSGLYVEGDNKGEIVDLITYMNNHTNYTPGSYVYNCEKNADKFFLFEKDHVTEERYKSIIEEYDTLRLKAIATIDSETINLWYKNTENQVVKNDNYESSAKIKVATQDWYRNYYDSYLQGYLTTTPAYYDLSKAISNYLFLLQIPVAFVFSITVVYFVPTLFFRHGRQTLGKALYRIGTVDKRLLAPTFWRNLAKFGLFVLEMLLGVASIGIIFIISFTMMAVSKKRQSFPEYMLGLQEVDISKNKIYMSMVEASLANAVTNKKPNDFKLIDEP